MSSKGKIPLGKFECLESSLFFFFLVLVFLSTCSCSFCSCVCSSSSYPHNSSTCFPFTSCFCSFCSCFISSSSSSAYTFSSSRVVQNRTEINDPRGLLISLVVKSQQFSTTYILGREMWACLLIDHRSLKSFVLFCQITIIGIRPLPRRSPD